MERKKIINILLSFSAVTNINSWRVKSALSNLVSLVDTKALKTKEMLICLGLNLSSLSDSSVYQKEQTLTHQPDRFFPENVDRRISR